MKLPRPTPRSEGEENLIPLINVVFLLLIFFMLAGRLTPPEALPVTPPESRSPQPAETGGLTVLIDAQGQVALDGEPVPVAELPARLARRLAEGRLAVQVKADAGLEARRLVQLLDGLRKAGVEELDLLTLGSGG